MGSYGARREELERDALRLLCSELLEPVTRAGLAGLLNHTAFGDELRRVVYEEIVAVGAISARRMKELMPGRVTLRGFPDFDLKEVLGRDGVRDEDIDRWFESLLNLMDERPTEKKKALGQSA